MASSSAAQGRVFVGPGLRPDFCGARVESFQTNNDGDRGAGRNGPGLMDRYSRGIIGGREYYYRYHIYFRIRHLPEYHCTGAIYD